MEITVSLNCTDKVIEVPVSKLMRYDYFKAVFSNCSTKITLEKIENVDQNGIKKISHQYTIPSVTIDCSSIIFNKLIRTGRICISPYKCDDELFELFYFNMFYGTGVKFRHNTCGFECNQYFGILEFIKSKIPNANVYDFLTNAGFSWETNCLRKYSYELGAKNGLPSCLVMDLIENIDSEYYWSLHNQKPKEIIHIMNFMVKCCDNGLGEIILDKVSDCFNKNIHGIYIGDPTGKIHISDSTSDKLKKYQIDKTFKAKYPDIARLIWSKLRSVLSAFLKN